MESNSQLDELYKNTSSEVSEQNDHIDKSINKRENDEADLGNFSANPTQKSVLVKPNSKKRRSIAIIVLLVTISFVVGVIVVFLKSDLWIYRNWWIYQENSYGYSIKLPPEWKEAIGNEYSEGVKQFDIKKVVDKNDPMISIFISPTQDGQLDEYNQLKSALPNDYVMYRDVKSLKVKDVELDGCEAPMIYTHQMEYDYGPRCDVICAGNKYTISLRLGAGTTNILNKYKSTYEKLVKTFKFNALLYKDPNFVPTPTLSEVEKFLNQPTVTDTPNVTSTPIVSDKEFSVYSNGRFTFFYPSNWEHFEYFQQVFVQEVANQYEPTYNFGVTWDQEQFYDSNLEKIKKGNWIKILETENFIGGLPALFIEGALEINNVIYLRKVYLVRSGGYIYTIDVWNLSTNDESEITNKILSSFDFTS